MIITAAAGFAFSSASASSTGSRNFRRRSREASDTRKRPMPCRNIMEFIHLPTMLIYVCLHQHRRAGEDGHPLGGRIHLPGGAQEGRREFQRRRPPARPREPVAARIRGGLEGFPGGEDDRVPRLPRGRGSALEGETPP